MATKDRPNVASVCEQLFQTARGFDLEILVMAYPNYEVREAFSKIGQSYNIDVEYTDAPRHEVLQEATRKAKGDLLSDLDDDIIPKAGWLAEVMKTLDYVDGYGYIKIPSQDNPGYWAERAVAPRRLYQEELGGVVYIPKYLYVYQDMEKTDRMLAKGLFYVANNALIEHHKPTDKTYYEGGVAHHDQDLKMYLDRKAAGFPNDYPSVL